MIANEYMENCRVSEEYLLKCCQMEVIEKNLKIFVEVDLKKYLFQVRK